VTVKVWMPVLMALTARTVVNAAFAGTSGRQSLPQALMATVPSTVLPLMAEAAQP